MLTLSFSLSLSLVSTHMHTHAHKQKREEKDSGSGLGVWGCAISKSSSVAACQLRSVCLNPPMDLLWPKEGISSHRWLCANSRHAMLSWVKICSPHSMLPIKKPSAENTDWLHKREEHKTLETPQLRMLGEDR